MFIQYCQTVICRMIFAMENRVQKREAGDVPGWVMITLMTAGLVVLLWGVVGPALVSLFQSAISKLTSIS